jgi:hypothetical protein
MVRLEQNKRYELFREFLLYPYPNKGHKVFFVCGVFIFQPIFIRPQIICDGIMLGVCRCDFYLGDP